MDKNMAIMMPLLLLALAVLVGGSIYFLCALGSAIIYLMKTLLTFTLYALGPIIIYLIIYLINQKRKRRYSLSNRSKNMKKYGLDLLFNWKRVNN